MTLAPVVVAVSFKAYLDDAAVRTWLTAVASMPRTPDVDVVVFPSFLSIPGAVAAAGGRLAVGAQNLHSSDRGAFTGEVTGPQVREAGCRFVEIGHAERERLFGETEGVVAGKLAAAKRNALVPLLCVGEPGRGAAPDAARWCADKVGRLLDASGYAGDIVVAYEPVWAIGAPEPAGAVHVRTVAAALRDTLATALPHDDARVIYGGAAGAGTLPALRGDVDGLFLGRFAHDPAAMRLILAEAAEQART